MYVQFTSFLIASVCLCLIAKREKQAMAEQHEEQCKHGEEGDMKSERVFTRRSISDVFEEIVGTVPVVKSTWEAVRIRVLDVIMCPETTATVLWAGNRVYEGK